MNLHFGLSILWFFFATRYYEEAKEAMETRMDACEYNALKERVAICSRFCFGEFLIGVSKILY